jgi:hypothetical protein
MSTHAEIPGGSPELAPGLAADAREVTFRMVAASRSHRPSSSLSPSDPSCSPRGVPPEIEVFVGQGSFRVLRTKAHVVVDCLLDHAIVVYPVDARGCPEKELQAHVRHDGPIWSIDALETRDGDLVVATGGVEDHPLDRTAGFFGYIDSFLFLYVARHGALTRTSAINLSAHAVVTPKAIGLDEDGAGVLTVKVTGYGGDHMAVLHFPDGPSALPTIASRVLPPGTSAFATIASGDLVIANRQLDAPFDLSHRAMESLGRCAE